MTSPIPSSADELRSSSEGPGIDRGPLAWIRNKPRRLLVALAVLALGLLVTAWATWAVKNTIETEARTSFSNICNEVTLKIQERLTAYALLLQGGQGLFAASESVTRGEWAAYVEALAADKTVPGYEGIGFSQLIAPEDLAAHVARIRSEGFPDYEVRPPGERDVYSAIVYLEPFRDRNLRAFGYDMFSEPVRQAAMARARDTGQPSLSGKVTLVQESDEDVQAGTLIYVPVYRAGMPLGNAEERRAALAGWVYSPYRMNDMMSGIVPDWRIHAGRFVDLHVYDGTAPDPKNLLFDSIPDGAPHTGKSFLHEERTIDFNGQGWLLVFNGTTSASEVSYLPAWATLATGLVISGLIFGMLMMIHRRSDALAETAKLAEQIRGMAFHDSLTGLPNRRVLHDRAGMALAAARRTGLPGALMMADLDNFKPLNDSHGHEAGDRLLVEVARRLRGCVRETDTVARLGGDEFVILLPGLDADAAVAGREAMGVAEKIREALSHPYVLPRETGTPPIEHVCSASVGVTLFCGSDSETDIIRRADEAMYEAKRSGRNRVFLHAV